MGSSTPSTPQTSNSNLSASYPAHLAPYICARLPSTVEELKKARGKRDLVQTTLDKVQTAKELQVLQKVAAKLNEKMAETNAALQTLTAGVKSYTDTLKTYFAEKRKSAAKRTRTATQSEATLLKEETENHKKRMKSGQALALQDKLVMIASTRSARVAPYQTRSSLFFSSVSLTS